MIILAGVSINMLVGDNGIITQAQSAQRETEEAQTFESAIPDPKIEPMTEEIELDIDEM